MDTALPVTEAEADEVELVLDGLLPVAALRLAIPDRGSSPVVLLDPESVPFAELTPGDPARLTRLRARSLGPFAHLRATRRDPDGPLLVVATGRPLHRHDVQAVEAAASGAPVVLLALTGPGRLWMPADLVHALQALGRWPVLTAALPARPELDAAAQDDRLDALARSVGATHVVLPGDEGPLSAAELEALLAAGATLPAGFTEQAVEQVLRAARPPRTQRGLVVLLTGLSGSGKSSIARGVVDRLTEASPRRVTLLDGDVVRTMLSSGLGFSRADRELNVRRIGWVAAEVARHGGTVVCAPIAPYAAVRAAVREMALVVGAEFLLVHVATPLAVCESRDRKGLYARARRGEIAEFTGISDPYEVPADADLRIDTTDTALEECVEQVWDLLLARGLVRAQPPGGVCG